MIDCIRTIWYVLTLRCEEAERVRARQAIGTAQRSEQLAERLHRLACKSCRRARRQLRILDGAVDGLRSSLHGPSGESSPSLSPDARHRIRASMTDEAKKSENDA